MTDILKEAGDLINGQRRQDYGGVTESFTVISGLWSAYLGSKVTNHDVVNLMVLLKVARARNGYHRDSYVDVCGYAALTEKLVEESELLGEHTLVKTGKPRVWGSLVEIPTDVQVADRTGAVWLYKLGRWGWLDIDDDLDSWIDIEFPDIWDSEGPFTEIIGDDRGAESSSGDSTEVLS